jgi:hypothetical protein
MLLSASNLPWRMHANAQHGFVMNDVSVGALVLGLCGPGKIHLGLNTAGVVTISGAGLPGILPCSVSGTMTTKPVLTIVEKKNPPISAR